MSETADEVTYANYVVCAVSSVVVDLPETFARLELQEQELPFRSLSLPIAIADAAAIAAARSDQPAPRPSSQDLLATVLQRHTIDVVAARVIDLDGSVYLAELDLMGPKGRVVVECRPSDAISAALRHPGGAPILVDERLLSS